MNRRTILSAALSAPLWQLAARTSSPTLRMVAAGSATVSVMGGQLFLAEDAKAIAPAVFAFTMLLTAYGLGRASVAVGADSGERYEPTSGAGVHDTTGASWIASSARGYSEAGPGGVVMRVNSQDGRIELRDRDNIQHQLADVNEAEAIFLSKLNSPYRPMVPWSERVAPNEQGDRLLKDVVATTQFRGQSDQVRLAYSRLYGAVSDKSQHMLLASQPTPAGQFMWMSRPLS